jgi:orotate phosphoribosyltransferase
MNAPPIPPVPQDFGGLPSYHGHFLLESGLHAETWLELDSLFLDPRALSLRLAALADLVAAHDVTAVCGPLLGGAFVAHAVATQLRLRFYIAERIHSNPEEGLFEATYTLPYAQRHRARQERFAVVDDVISAGSSVRATVNELSSLGAQTVVVGALLTLGSRASEHFSQSGIPVIAPASREFSMWEPNHCPHCRAGVPLQSAPV